MRTVTAVNASDPSVYLVECYWPDVTAEKLAAANAGAMAAVDRLRREGHDAALVGSLLVPGDETVFWLVSGGEASAGAVRAAVGVACERVVACRWTPVAVARPAARSG